ncbi:MULTISPECIES: hypothetical protein [unclassified Streptomyces]|uniref:hypothetical protein n=1 Tax=unclassified Streptomyces TaxID=2593676 RepID=UPI001655B3E6|nr:hypothetical protein [Streptomyces sp. CB02980]MCB8901891.1 hypothetical protein [Streptomyces sp. CB02980]
MESTRIWSDGPVGDEAAASGGLLRLLGGGSGAEVGGAEPGIESGEAEAGIEAGEAEAGIESGGAESGTESGGAESGTESGGAERRIVTGPLVCRYCAWDRFEVTSDECFCEGCCLPLDVQEEEEEEECGGADPVVLELRPPAALSPGTDMDMVTCPAGHDLFQVAAAYTLGPDGHLRRLSVALRCPVDGALCLLVDDASVAPGHGR